MVIMLLTGENNIKYASSYPTCMNWTMKNWFVQDFKGYGHDTDEWRDYDYNKVFIKSLNKLLHIIKNYDNRVYVYYVLSSLQILFLCSMPVNTHKQTQKGSNQSEKSSDQTWKCWAPGSAQNFFGLRTPQPKKEQSSTQ